MKYFSFLFSLYLLGLALLPCGDRHDCELIGDIDFFTTATDHSDHHKDAEHCSPFCICTCCGQNGQPEYFPWNIRAVSGDPVQSVLAYEVIIPASPDFSIWQPPKIS